MRFNSTHTKVGQFLAIAFVMMTALATLPQAQAQDTRFAQFYAAPLQTNPAMIGVYEGQWRFAANYRTLYASVLANKPFRTMAASFDARRRVMKGDYVGFGLSAVRDQVGTSQFSQTQVMLGASFMKQLGGGGYSRNSQYLIAGAQLGFGQRSFNWQELWFSSQYDGGNNVIDFGSDSGEGFADRNSKQYLDFNAGLLWYAIADDNLSIYFGGALHHINTPNVSFRDLADEKLYSRWVAHTGGELPLGDNLSVLPAVAVMKQGPSFSTTAGANFRYTSRDWREVAIRAGGWAHVSNQLDKGMTMDAVIVSAILEMERWNLGLSYDITTSKLASVNNSRGAFEVSLIYTHPEKTRLKVNCPKF